MDRRERVICRGGTSVSVVRGGGISRLRLDEGVVSGSLRTCVARSLKLPLLSGWTTTGHVTLVSQSRLFSALYRFNRRRSENEGCTEIIDYQAAAAESKYTQSKYSLCKPIAAIRQSRYPHKLMIFASLPAHPIIIRYPRYPLPSRVGRSLPIVRRTITRLTLLRMVRRISLILLLLLLLLPALLPIGRALPVISALISLLVRLLAMLLWLHSVVALLPVLLLLLSRSLTRRWRREVLALSLARWRWVLIRLRSAVRARSAVLVALLAKRLILLIALLAIRLVLLTTLLLAIRLILLIALLTIRLVLLMTRRLSRRRRELILLCSTIASRAAAVLAPLLPIRLRLLLPVRLRLLRAILRLPILSWLRAGAVCLLRLPVLALTAVLSATGLWTRTAVLLLAVLLLAWRMVRAALGSVAAWGTALRARGLIRRWRSTARVRPSARLTARMRVAVLIAAGVGFAVASQEVTGHGPELPQPTAAAAVRASLLPGLRATVRR